MSELEELIKDRREKVRLMKKDGDNSHRLLADLYGSPAHFITELLQNAEDEGAKNVTFKLTASELIFSHDAKNLFDFKDIRAISNFGDNQEKKEKPNAIGRFGIGFKSVYSITDNPRIISADFDITIRDYNIPERTNGLDPEYFEGTKIILPFKSEIKERTNEFLNIELHDLNLHYLLFLSNITSIKWETENENGIYERVVSKKDNRIITLKSSVKEIKYFLLQRLVPIDNKILAIKIAFQFADSEKKSIVSCDKSPLYVFFPTKIETNLKFLVHAPFYTTPGRENIQEDVDVINIEPDHRNEELKIELGKLLVESMSVFKSLRMLNVNLLNVLPIDKENCKRSTIYKELYEAIKGELKSKKQLLPNSNGGYSSSADLMLSRSADLTDLINTIQAKKIFGRNSWSSKNITNDKTKILRDYLYNEINIPEYDLADFANKIEIGFMEEQTDKWLIQFYNVVHKSQALWRIGTRSANNGILRSKPIIRVNIKDRTKHVIPFQQNGKPNAFLPTKEQSKYATVKLNIAKNKEARKFLEDLGLTTPDIFAEINEFIIPKFKTGETYHGYFEDLINVLEATQSTNLEKRNRLIQDLKECPFLLGYNIVTGEVKNLKYNQLYNLTENLKTFFDSNPTTFFVAEDQYSFASKDLAKFQTLLKEIGVKDYPNRIPFPKTLSWQEKIKLNNGDYSIEHWCHDYKLDGLSYFLENEITLEKSIALWQLLVNASSKHNTPQLFFQGEYAYKYYSEYTKYFPSFFLSQLKENAWLIVDEIKYRPSEISYSLLPNSFKENSYDLRALADILGFKPDEIKAIEDRFGGKFVTGEKLKMFEQWEAEQFKNEPKSKTREKEDEGFTPEFKPEEANLNSRELDDTDVIIAFNTQQGTTHQIDSDLTNEQSEYNIPETKILEDKDIEKPNQKLLIDIGNWGQSYVSRELTMEFESDKEVEILDLNIKGEKGVGCDFMIKKKGQIIRLVEVKATIEKFGQILSISGTQWEVARNYFKMNDGDKYWIYCVFNAGQEYAELVKIKNPIQKWKDGKLLAHPVNFVIK